ncbi:hypothetical protein EZV62_026712 [Acer yangbiense]|uniref:ADP/ATP translocase n=1 Tax=Acer yangbiense TaxID=1000413 RepID=A0A5C7GRS8_9ROSI|nr:hypothetical protein EZV62_026712 [Acer yangbiense]
MASGWGLPEAMNLCFGSHLTRYRVGHDPKHKFMAFGLGATRSHEFVLRVMTDPISGQTGFSWSNGVVLAFLEEFGWPQDLKINSTLAFFNGVLQSHLGLPHQGSASSSITPMPSKSVRVPSKKLNAIDLLWVTSTTITAPVNRVMVLIRCQNEMIKSGRLSYPYKGIADCFARTVRTEGIISLWKGNSTHLMGIAIKKFLSESALVNCLSLFNYKKEDGFWKKLNGLLAAYGVSSAAILCLIHPFEYASTRITNDIKTGSIFGKRQFNGIIDVFKKTIKSDSIAGLYCGYKVAYVAYFVNDMLLSVLKQYRPHETLGLQHSVLAGVIAVTGGHLLVNLITHPMHTVVQRMMMRSGEAIRNFHKTQTSNSITVTFAFLNGVLQSRLGPPHQGSASASPTGTTMPSKVPSKKGKAIDEVFTLLFGVTIMTTAPLNRVMHLMRCQNEMIKSGRLSHPYKGIADCFARTVRNEGIISLWKGNTTYTMGLMPDKFISGSTAMDNCLSLFNYKKEDSFGKKFVGLLAADSIPRAVTLFFIHPLQYSETRMANDIRIKSIFKKGQFNGIIDVFRKTLKSDGIAGLYRGYNMAYAAFFVYDVVLFALKPKQLLETLGLQHSVLAFVIAGAGHHLLCDLITYPMLTVVQRMMMRSGETVKYKNSFDAFSQILKNEGVRSLYKGASAQIIIHAVRGGSAMIYGILLKNSRSGQPTNNIDIKWKNGEDGGKGSQ